MSAPASSTLHVSSSSTSLSEARSPLARSLVLEWQSAEREVARLNAELAKCGMGADQRERVARIELERARLVERIDFIKENLSKEQSTPTSCPAMDRPASAENPTDDHVLALSVKLAREAGVLIADAVRRPRAFATKSSIIDCVTETDEQCERVIIAAIRAQFPTHHFIAEESYKGDGKYDITKEPTWIIDPIDGTNNFVHGLHHTCVSIGYMVDGVVRVGVVHAPLLNETYTAVIGRGAYLNETKMAVSTIDRLDGAAISSEFGYDRTEEGIPWLMSRMTALLRAKTQSVRMFGSCALNMCFVAAGRTDGYFEGKDTKYGPKPWDTAAAQLIVTEAGGVVGDPEGGAFDITNGRILAANSPALRAALQAVVQDAANCRITFTAPATSTTAADERKA